MKEDYQAVLGAAGFGKRIIPSRQVRLSLACGSWK
jgi:hypothetical protein